MKMNKTMYVAELATRSDPNDISVHACYTTLEKPDTAFIKRDGQYFPINSLKTRYNIALRLQKPGEKTAE